MAAAALQLLPAIIGGLGLIQNSQSQKSSNNLVNQGIAAQQPQIQAQNNLLQEATAYNPAQQDAIAFQGANQNATNLLDQSLSNVAGRYASGGGAFGNDTGFQAAQNNAANGIVGPLVQQQQALVATEPQRKMQAMSGVFQAPSGQLANTYFNAAQMKSPSAGSWQSALANLAAGLAPPTGSGLTGGSGGGLSYNSPSTVGDFSMPTDMTAGTFQT